MNAKTVWGIIIIVLSVAAGLFGSYKLASAANQYRDYREATINHYRLKGTSIPHANQLAIDSYRQPMVVPAFIIIFAIGGAIGGTVMVKKADNASGQNS